MLKNLNLEGLVAIVTGATAGIGKAIALRLAQAGATIYAIGTNKERGDEVEREAEAKTGRKSIIFSQTDISSKEQVDKAIDDCLNRFQKIDILINNAGVTRDGLLLRMKEEDWDKVLNVNLKSCFYTCQAVLRPMMKAKQGKIINVSSVVGLIGNPGQTNYAASKAGLIAFSKSLAKEMASRNILVNCIAPGYIETQMTEALGDELKQAVVKNIPLGRMGTANDIADAALFLASPLSAYMTGQVLVVDGGLTMLVS